MARSAEIAFSASENRFTSEPVEYRAEACGDTPIGQLFASIGSQREPMCRKASAALRTKLRRRKAGRVRLTDPEIGELVWLLDNVIHHDYPADTLRAFKRTLAKLRSAPRVWPKASPRAGCAAPCHRTLVPVGGRPGQGTAQGPVTSNPITAPPAFNVSIRLPAVAISSGYPLHKLPQSFDGLIQPAVVGTVPNRQTPPACWPVLAPQRHDR